jgi:hypothetical protein
VQKLVAHATIIVMIGTTMIIAAVTVIIVMMNLKSVSYIRRLELDVKKSLPIKRVKTSTVWKSARFGIIMTLTTQDALTSVSSCSFTSAMLNTKTGPHP